MGGIQKTTAKIQVTRTELLNHSMLCMESFEQTIEELLELLQEPPSQAAWEKAQLMVRLLKYQKAAPKKTSAITHYTIEVDLLCEHRSTSITRVQKAIYDKVVDYLATLTESVKFAVIHKNAFGRNMPSDTYARIVLRFLLSVGLVSFLGNRYFPSSEDFKIKAQKAWDDLKATSNTE